MSGGELLGVAVLELRTDNRQLETGLVAARAAVDRETQKMQTTTDRRMASMNMSLRSVGDAADEMAAAFARATVTEETLANSADASAAAFLRQAAAINEAASATRDLAAARTEAAAAGGGGALVAGGGNKRTDIFHHTTAGAVGGGGGGGGRTILWGHGGGVPIPFGGRIGGGLAGFGTVGGLAGLGAEHALTTLLALVGSLTSATAGLGAVALGAFGNFAVGAGSDIAVMSSTIADTQALYKSYTAVEKAVQQYGAGSTQAATAQKALNAQMTELGNNAGTKAELGLAKATDALNTYWDKATSTARVRAVDILQQVVALGHTYVPLVASAAAQNLAIVNKDLKPLFTWLNGPQGIGIFNHLENNFRKNLPDAIHALDQGLEFFLRTMNIASNYTGGFTKMLDRFFTRMNDKSNWQINQEVHKLVDDFRLWEHLIKILGQDLYALFKNDAGTGNTIVQYLTQMLTRLHEWEVSSQGSRQLRTIFQVHRDEIIALFNALVALMKPFSAIYMTLAPPLVKAVTGVAGAFADVLNAVDSLGPAARDLVGLTLLAGKFGFLSKMITAVGKSLGFMGGQAVVASDKMAGATAAGGGIAEMSGLERGMTGLGASVAGVSPGLGVGVANLGPKLTALMKPAMFAGGGILAGTMVQGMVPGLKKNLPETLGGGVLGGLLGGAVGGPWGAAIGGGLGSTFGPTVASFFSNFFQTQGEADGKRLASGLEKTFNPDLSVVVREQFDKATKSYAQTVGQLIDQLRTKTSTAPGGRFQTGTEPGVAISQSEANQLAAKAQHLMEVAFKNHPVSPQSFEGMMSKALAGMPPSMKVAAAKGMLQFADELRSKGKLSESALEEIVRYAQKIAPGLATTLGFWGKTSADKLAQDWKFPAARQNLQSLLQTVNHTWVTGLHDQNATQKQMITDAGKNMKMLRNTITTQTGATRKQALADYQKLQSGVAGYFKAMVSDSQQKMKSLVAEVQQGNQAAESNFTSQWARVSHAVYAAMASGALSTAQGGKILADNTNAILKSFGAKGIPTPTLISALRATQPANVHDQPGSGIGHRATGGYERPEAGGRVIRVAEGGYPEVVLTTDPKHTERQRGLLAQYLKAAPHVLPRYGTGGYVYPIAPGVPIGRTDQGIDPQAPAGKPFGPIGDATIHSTSIGGWPGGPMMFWQLTNGPMAGRFVYLAEEIRPTVHPGQHVSAHQAVAVSTGPSQEMGWATASGATLARSLGEAGGNNANTAAGAAFRAFLAGLSHGKLVGGGIGGVAIPTVNAPQIKGGGTWGRAEQADMDKGAAAANAYISKKALALGFGGAGFSGSIPGNLSGPVMHQIYQAISPPANKMGAAGAIGNASRESGLNPASVGSGGGGLWGFTPLGPEQDFARIQGRPWTDVGVQATFMLYGPGQGGAHAIMDANRAANPSQAADIFMNEYEHPGIPAAADREAAAQAAFAAGYAKGGFIQMPHGIGGSYGLRGRSGGSHGHWKPPHDKVWDFIHKATRQFPPDDLGRHWFDWLNHKMAFGRVKAAGITPKGIDEGLLKWAFNIENRIVPRIQERESQLSSLYSASGGSPTGKQQHHLIDLDRAAVSYLLWALHGLERFEPALAERIQSGAKFVKGEKGKNPENKNLLSSLRKSMARLQKQKRALIGVSGIGGTLGDAEVTLMSDIGSSQSSSGDKTSALLALEEQRNLNLMEKLYLMRQQYRVLAGLPTSGGKGPTDAALWGLSSPMDAFSKAPTAGMVLPQFGGVFHRGGVVPGYRGEERTIVAQAGEVVSHGGGQISFVFEKGCGVDPERIKTYVDGQLRRWDRGAAGRANLRLPSRGGGQIPV